MKEKYIEDLKDIKDIMKRSSRFISLSGLAGISAGIIALIGAYLAHQLVFLNQDYQSFNQIHLADESRMNLIYIALGTLVLAIGATIVLTNLSAKKHNQNIWDQQTKRLFSNLLIPLISGGIVCAVLLYKGYLGIAIPLSIIFFGLSLVNASKYTLNEVRTLGLVQVLLGLIALFIINHALLIWAIGFGVVLIVYGIIMKWKYKS
ncbi:MAG: hypothetical protein KJO77_09080 [Bacteroidia bacterium]|nr:hypothetical protein [Bacteroidia bacterium]